MDNIIRAYDRGMITTEEAAKALIEEVRGPKPRYVFQLWVTVEADNLEDAISRAHEVSRHLENDELPVHVGIVDTLIGDEYERVINEYGDTEIAEE